MMDRMRNFITSELSEPAVFCNMISDWPALSWTPQTLHSLMNNKTVKVRLGPLIPDKDGVLWEGDCDYEDVSYSELSDWLDGQCTGSNPMMQYDKSVYWCYVDYKHMADIFQDEPEALKSVDWSMFGFDGRDGGDSTMWIGSAGAHTPCHYDTYGCNLVAQIYGRKRWQLYPPEQTDMMYPTRIPYEESSVFSNVNIKHPNLQRHAKFKSVTPYIVMLGPGDVLFVPRHWWHYVECLDTAISINSWIELPVDKEERLSEAVTRTLVCALMHNEELSPSLSSEGREWLNPTEESTPHIVNMAYINQSLRALYSGKSESTKNSHDTDEKNTIHKKHNMQKRTHDEDECCTDISGPYELSSSSEKSFTKTESPPDVDYDKKYCDEKNEKIDSIQSVPDMKRQKTIQDEQRTNKDKYSNSLPQKYYEKMKIIDPISFEQFLKMPNPQNALIHTDLTTDSVSVIDMSSKYGSANTDLLEGATETSLSEEEQPDVEIPSGETIVTTETLLSCVTHPSVVSKIVSLLRTTQNEEID